MTPPLPRRPRWRSLALLALCLAPLLWPLEHLAERYYRSELAGQNRQTLDLYVANLLGNLRRDLQSQALQSLLQAMAAGTLREPMVNRMRPSVSCTAPMMKVRPKFHQPTAKPSTPCVSRSGVGNMMMRPVTVTR